jgi:hypothetical protein
MVKSVCGVELFEIRRDVFLVPRIGGESPRRLLAEILDDDEADGKFEVVDEPLWVEPMPVDDEPCTSRIASRASSTTCCSIGWMEVEIAIKFSTHVSRSWISVRCECLFSSSVACLRLALIDRISLL